MNGVSFKGLYAFSADRRGKGDSWGQTGTHKIVDFIEDTKPFRTDDGYSYIDNRTGDFYFSVNDEKEKEFENVVKRYDIDCEKVCDTVSSNKGSADDEADGFMNKIRELLAKRWS